MLLRVDAACDDEDRARARGDQRRRRHHLVDRQVLREIAVKKIHHGDRERHAQPDQRQERRADPARQTLVEVFVGDDRDDRIDDHDEEEAGEIDGRDVEEHRREHDRGQQRAREHDRIEAEKRHGPLHHEIHEADQHLRGEEEPCDVLDAEAVLLEERLAEREERRRAGGEHGEAEDRQRDASPVSADEREQLLRHVLAPRAQFRRSLGRLDREAPRAERRRVDREIRGIDGVPRHLLQQAAREHGERAGDQAERVRAQLHPVEMRDAAVDDEAVVEQRGVRAVHERERDAEERVQTDERHEAVARDDAERVRAIRDEPEQHRALAPERIAEHAGGHFGHDVREKEHALQDADLIRVEALVHQEDDEDRAIDDREREHPVREVDAHVSRAERIPGLDGARRVGDGFRKWHGRPCRSEAAAVRPRGRGGYWIVS
ncbi:hypothetical protein Y033_5381 [Burkholderia pseudomallei MSHR435]|nr:hypothetical protein Y033_5381 [Burkholderia pseudomallei MSHR435]